MVQTSISVAKKELIFSDINQNFSTLGNYTLNNNSKFIDIIKDEYNVITGIFRVSSLS